MQDHTGAPAGPWFPQGAVYGQLDSLPGHVDGRHSHLSWSRLSAHSHDARGADSAGTQGTVAGTGTTTGAQGGPYTGIAYTGDVATGPPHTRLVAAIPVASPPSARYAAVDDTVNGGGYATFGPLTPAAAGAVDPRGGARERPAATATNGDGRRLFTSPTRHASPAGYYRYDATSSSGGSPYMPPPPPPTPELAAYRSGAGGFTGGGGSASAAGAAPHTRTGGRAMWGVGSPPPMRPPRPGGPAPRASDVAALTQYAEISRTASASHADDGRYGPADSFRRELNAHVELVLAKYGIASPAQVVVAGHLDGMRETSPLVTQARQVYPPPQTVHGLSSSSDGALLMADYYAGVSDSASATTPRYGSPSPSSPAPRSGAPAPVNAPASSPYSGYPDNHTMGGTHHSAMPSPADHGATLVSGAERVRAAPPTSQHVPYRYAGQGVTPPLPQPPQAATAMHRELAECRGIIAVLRERLDTVTRRNTELEREVITLRVAQRAGLEVDSLRRASVSSPASNGSPVVHISAASKGDGGSPLLGDAGVSQGDLIAEMAHAGANLPAGSDLYGTAARPNVWLDTLGDHHMGGATEIGRESLLTNGSVLVSVGARSLDGLSEGSTGGGDATRGGDSGSRDNGSAAARRGAAASARTIEHMAAMQTRLIARLTQQRDELLTTLDDPSATILDSGGEDRSETGSEGGSQSDDGSGSAGDDARAPAEAEHLAGATGAPVMVALEHTVHPIPEGSRHRHRA